MKFSKLLVTFLIVTASMTASARTSQKDCQDYGAIVGSMQDIRNKGGSFELAFKDLRELITSSDALNRNYGKTLTEIAQIIWSKPVGHMTERGATEVGTIFCENRYR